MVFFLFNVCLYLLIFQIKNKCYCIHAFIYVCVFFSSGIFLRLFSGGRQKEFLSCHVFYHSRPFQRLTPIPSSQNCNRSSLCLAPANYSVKKSSVYVVTTARIKNESFIPKSMSATITESVHDEIISRTMLRTALLKR